MQYLSLGQIGDSEIKQLKIFKAVVDCGGFSAAETELNISRPAISNHIANLEARLNMRLCKRGRGGFSMTVEGEVVYDQTNQLLERLEQFRNTINNLGVRPAGQLKITLSDSFSNDPRCRLPSIFSGFCKRAPEVELKVEVGKMSSMENMVLNDKLDLAFIPYHRRLDGLNYLHLFTDENYLYCAKEHPLFILPDTLITTQMINAAKLVHAGLKPHDEVHHMLFDMNLAGLSYHYETRISMAMSGQFICFLPQEIARPYVDSGELRAIATETKSFTLGAAVISKKTAQPNRAKDLFLQTIRDIFSDTDTRAPY
ncbi:LysR family transcriptional regulator ['Osedax' symbiont bacterium Rs2_46_30_T18]|nr:LysR family transcriptional regulator ['Osedax' symbiont bacterium Rs2_46_30_T18]